MTGAAFMPSKEIFRSNVTTQPCRLPFRTEKSGGSSASRLTVLPSYPPYFGTRVAVSKKNVSMLCTAETKSSRLTGFVMYAFAYPP